MAPTSNELQDQLGSFNELFSHYQQIPDFVFDKYFDENFEPEYEVKQLLLDAPRYKFLTSNLNCNNLSVVEIGSNLGYFCLSLAHDFDCRAKGFEPITNYQIAATLLAEICGLTELCRFSEKSISLADINYLPQADLYIELNVMHHAGVVFDKEYVENLKGWRNYTIAKLEAYRTKSKFLFFQTGNTANGNTLFPSSDAVTFTSEILQESGWEIQALGTIPDLSKLQYEKHNSKQLALGTTYVCSRNPTTNLVDYFFDGTLSASLITGLASRPIWLCRNTG